MSMKSTKQPWTTISMPEQAAGMVADYMHEHKLRSRGEAILQAFEALKVLEQKPIEPEKPIKSIDQKKKCSKCKESKQLSEFTSTGRGKDTYCKDCRAQMSRERRAKSKKNKIS